MNAFLTEHNPGQRDTTGRFKKKVSTTLKQAETRKKEREKSSARGLKFSDKFAKLSDDEEGFHFVLYSLHRMEILIMLEPASLSSTSRIMSLCYILRTL